jgi:hypothetical protein
MWLEDHFGSGLQRNARVKLAASFWNNVGAGMVIGGMACAAVRKDCSAAAPGRPPARVGGHLFTATTRALAVRTGAREDH